MRGVWMSNNRRVPEKNLGLFFTPADGASGAGFVVPMANLNVGPGKTGPGDEWRVPTGPVETEDDVSLEPVHSDGTVVLPLHPTDKV
jgi:hypothetical protein